MASIAAALMLLSGCASLTKPQVEIQSSVKASEDALKRLEASKAAGPIRTHKGPRLAGTEIRVLPPEVMPSAFFNQFGYQSVPQPVSALFTDLSRRTGMTIRIQPGLRNATSGGSGQQSPNLEKPMALSWNGTLKGLFDHLAEKTHLSWKFSDGVVEFFRTETRTFTIYIPAGKKMMSSSIQLSGSNGEEASKGNNLVDVSSTSTIDPYEAILSAVELIVRDGSKDEGSAKNVVANPALGSITVTATPTILDKVDRYIKANNEKFAQNVIIGVKVYNVTLNRGANAGASATISYENLSRNLGLDLISPAPLAPTNGTPGTFNAAITGSRFGGSNMLVQALERLGDVALVTSGQVLTANGQPAPLQVANEFVYLASSTSTPFTNGTNTGVTTTLVPGSRTVGFTANFVPLILSENRLLLQYQINLSSLIKIDQATSGGSSIQTPSLAMQSLQQQAYMRDGETLVLFGYEQKRHNDERNKSWLGFSRNTDTDRTVMVVMLEVFLGK